MENGVLGYPMPGKVWTSAKRRRAQSAATLLGTSDVPLAAQPAWRPMRMCSNGLRRSNSTSRPSSARSSRSSGRSKPERAEIDTLKAQLQASESESAKAPDRASLKSPKPRLAITGAAGRGYHVRERASYVRSGDRNYSLSVHGRLQFDAAAYFQDAAGPLSTDWRRGSIGGGRENIAATDLSSGSNFAAPNRYRRRLGRSIRYRYLPEFGSRAPRPTRACMRVG